MRKTREKVVKGNSVSSMNNFHGKRDVLTKNSRKRFQNRIDLDDDESRDDWKKLIITRARHDFALFIGGVEGVRIGSTPSSKISWLRTTHPLMGYIA